MVSAKRTASRVFPMPPRAGHRHEMRAGLEARAEGFDVPGASDEGRPDVVEVGAGGLLHRSRVACAREGPAGSPSPPSLGRMPGPCDEPACSGSTTPTRACPIASTRASPPRRWASRALVKINRAARRATRRSMRSARVARGRADPRRQRRPRGRRADRARLRRPPVRQLRAAARRRARHPARRGRRQATASGATSSSRARGARRSRAAATGARRSAPSCASTS